MALLAEEIVEEWLNRQGYFTIRGIKMGVQEIDLLAIKCNSDGSIERRHLEVQVSMRPVSYISKVPKSLQKTGRAANSAKRTGDELRQGIEEWVEKKFFRPDKKKLMHKLCSGNWTSELVAHKVKSDEELKIIESYGVKIHRFGDIVSSLYKPNDRFDIGSASGADIIELILMGLETKPCN